MRGADVTGVQACALPIYGDAGPGDLAVGGDDAVGRRELQAERAADREQPLADVGGVGRRSEERRVGKGVELGGGRARQNEAAEGGGGGQGMVVVTVSSPE